MGCWSDIMGENETGDKMAEVSIIIPVYNKYKYIWNLYENLKEQIFSDFEAILVDDGSSDGSEIVCDKIAQNDSRFHVIHIFNAGVSHARNVGLENAKGKYITFIDADDFIHSNYLKNLVDCIEKADVDMVIGTMVKVWDDTEHAECIPMPYTGVVSMNTVVKTFAEEQLKSGIYGFCCSKIINRDRIGNIRFDEKISLAEDLDFYLSIYPQITNIYFDNKGYYYYRQDAENSSMQKPDNQINYLDQLRIQFKMYQFLESSGGLDERSRSLVINRLYDYVFFALFHAEVKNIKNYCFQIRELQLPKPRQKSKCSWRQQWIVSLFKWKADSLLVLTRKIYDKIRKLKL